LKRGHFYLGKNRTFLLWLDTPYANVFTTLFERYIMPFLIIEDFIDHSDPGYLATPP